MLIKKICPKFKWLLFNQDVNFKSRDELEPVIKSADVSACAIRPFDVGNCDYNQVPGEENQVASAFMSISNTLDPISFAEAAVNKTATSKMKMSLGATSSESPQEVDNLWVEDPWSVTVNLNDLEETMDVLMGELDNAAKIKAACKQRAKGVTPEHLSKI